MFNCSSYCCNSVELVFSSFEMESDEEVMMTYNADGELGMSTEHKLEQDEKQGNKRECSLTLTD